MPAQPLISIVTPAYNASVFIKETYESIVGQDYENWEWLCVVDKNSTDATKSIVKQLAGFDKRVKCLSPSLVSGAAENRNFAISKSSGEFIAFLDADDLWAPGKLSRQLEFMKSRGIDFSYTGYEWMNELGEPLGKELAVPTSISYADLLSHRHAIGCLTVMIRKAAFKDLKYEDIGAEDFTFWLKLLRQVPLAHGINESMGKYRIVEGSRSRNKFRWARYRWESMRAAERISLLPALYYFALYAFRSVINRL